MASPGHENALDRVVAVRFENRSFDNRLGRLYEPGEFPIFEGVLGEELSTPIPEWHPDVDRGPGSYGVATNMNTPAPDPGEGFHPVNTHLFGVQEEANRGRMEAKGSSNDPAAQRPMIDGFVTYSEARRICRSDAVVDEHSLTARNGGRRPSDGQRARSIVIFFRGWLCQGARS